ncbi:MAG: DUF1573 domain-containing protein [Flavobacteriales bacterium]
MKRIVLSAVLLPLCAFAIQAQTHGAVFRFDTKKVDFGTIVKGSKGIKKLGFTNVGDAPLIISNIRSACGCTVPSWPKRPIKPGDSGFITVRYDTQRVGPFRKSISVFSNAKEGRKVIKVVGEVKA